MWGTQLGHFCGHWSFSEVSDRVALSDVSDRDVGPRQTKWKLQEVGIFEHQKGGQGVFRKYREEKMLENTSER